MRQRENISRVSTEFPQEDVLNIGAQIEGILFQSNTSQQNVCILEYLREYIIFRKTTQVKNNLYSLEKLNALREKMKLCEKQVYALNLWARGSRKNINQTLSERELDFLYERINRKLFELDNPS